MSDVHDLEDFLTFLDDHKELKHGSDVQQPVGSHMHQNILDFNTHLNPLSLNVDSSNVQHLVQGNTSHVQDVSMVENSFMPVEEAAPSGGSLGSLFLSSVDEMLSSEKTPAPNITHQNIKSSPIKNPKLHKPKKVKTNKPISTSYQNMHYLEQPQQSFLKKNSENNLSFNTNLMESNPSQTYMDNTTFIRPQHTKQKQELKNLNANDNLHMLSSTNSNFSDTNNKPNVLHGGQVSVNSFSSLHHATDSKIMSELELCPCPTLPNLMDDQSHLQYLNTGSTQDNLLEDLSQLKHHFYEQEFSFPGEVHKKSTANLSSLMSSNVVQNSPWMGEMVHESYPHPNQPFNTVYSSTIGTGSTNTQSSIHDKLSSTIEMLSMSSQYAKEPQDGLTMNQSQILDSLTSGGKNKPTTAEPKKEYNQTQSRYLQNTQMYSGQMSSISNTSGLPKEFTKPVNVLKSLDAADTCVTQMFSNNAYEAISPVSNYPSSEPKSNSFVNPVNSLDIKTSQDPNQLVNKKDSKFALSAMELHSGVSEKSNTSQVSQYQNQSVNQHNKTLPKQEKSYGQVSKNSLEDDFEFDQNNDHDPTIRLPPTAPNTISPKKTPAPGAVMTINRDTYSDQSVYDTVQELAALQQKRKSLMDALESQNKLIHGGQNALYNPPISTSNILSHTPGTLHKSKNYSSPVSEAPSSSIAKKPKKTSVSSVSKLKIPASVASTNSNNNFVIDKMVNSRSYEVPMASMVSNSYKQEKFDQHVSKLPNFPNQQVPKTFENPMPINSTQKSVFNIPPPMASSVNEYLNASVASSIKNSETLFTSYSTYPVASGNGFLSNSHISSVYHPIPSTMPNTMNTSTHETMFTKLGKNMTSAGRHPSNPKQSEEATLQRKFQESIPAFNEFAHSWQLPQQMQATMLTTYNANTSNNVPFNAKSIMPSTADSFLKQSHYTSSLAGGNFSTSSMLKEHNSVAISFEKSAQPYASLSSTMNVSLPDMSQMHLDYKGMKSTPNVALTSFSSASNILASRPNPPFNQFSPNLTNQVAPMYFSQNKTTEVPIIPGYNGKAYTTPTFVNTSLCQTNSFDNPTISTSQTNFKNPTNPNVFPTLDHRPQIDDRKVSDTSKSKENIEHILPKCLVQANANSVFTSINPPVVCTSTSYLKSMDNNTNKSHYQLPSYKQAFTLTEKEKTVPVPTSSAQISPHSHAVIAPKNAVIKDVVKDDSSGKMNISKPAFEDVKEVQVVKPVLPTTNMQNVVKNVNKPVEKRDALLKDKSYHGPKKKHILDRYQGQNTPTNKKNTIAAADKSKKENAQEAILLGKDEKSKVDKLKHSEKPNKLEKSNSESNLSQNPKVPEKNSASNEKSSGMFSLFDSLLQEASQSASDSLKSISNVKLDKKITSANVNKTISNKTTPATTANTHKNKTVATHSSTITSTEKKSISNSVIQKDDKQLEPKIINEPSAKSNKTEDLLNKQLNFKKKGITNTTTTTLGALNFPFKRRHAYVTTTTTENKISTPDKNPILESVLTTAQVSTVSLPIPLPLPEKQTPTKTAIDIPKKQGLKLKITAFRSAAGNVIHQSSFLGEQPESSNLDTGLYSRKRRKRKKAKKQHPNLSVDKSENLIATSPISVPITSQIADNTILTTSSITNTNKDSIINVKSITTKKKERSQKRPLPNAESNEPKKKTKLGTKAKPDQEIRYRLSQSVQLPVATSTQNTFSRAPGKQPFYLTNQGKLLYKNSSVPTIQLTQKSKNNSTANLPVQPSPKIVTVEIASPPGKTSVAQNLTKTMLANVRTILQTSPAISNVSGPQRIFIPKNQSLNEALSKSLATNVAAAPAKITFPLQVDPKIIGKSIIIKPHSSTDTLVSTNLGSKATVPSTTLNQKVIVTPRPYLSTIGTTTKNVLSSPVPSDKMEKGLLSDSIKSAGESRFQNAFSQLISSCNPIKKYVPPSECPYFGINNTITKHTCFECGDAFLNSFSLQHHYGRRSILVKVKCVQCNKNLIFFNKCEILKHAREHSEKGDVMQFNDAHLSPIPLSLCQPRTKEFFLHALEERSKLEAATVTNTSIACTECSFSTNNPNLLEKHFQNQTTTDRRTCDICHLIICNSCMFSAHMRMHKHVAPYTCPECGNTFQGHAMEFNVHLRIHCLHLCRISCFKCKLCNLNFLTDDQLRNHLRIDHVQVFYKCKECPMAYKTTSNIINHQRTVHNLTPEPSNLKTIYKCPLCDTVFNDSSSRSQQLFVLHRHFDTHIESTRIIAYKCYICKKVLEEKHLLREHLLMEHNVNSTEKEGKADDNMISESVSPISNLPGKKIYPCTECSKIFQSSHSRSSHVRSVHRGIKASYCCPHCPEGEIKFAKKITLVKHLARLHNIKDPSSKDIKIIKTLSNYSPSKKPNLKLISNTMQKSVLGNHGGPRVKITTRNPRLRVQNQKKKALGLVDPGSDESFGEVDEKMVEQEWNIPIETVVDKNEDNSDEITSPDFSQLNFPEIYVCVKCDFQEKERLLFQNHIIEHQNSSFPENSSDNSAALTMVQCSECGLCFASTFTLDKHLHIKHKIHDRNLLEKYDAKLRSEFKEEDLHGSNENLAKNNITQLFRCKVCFRQFDQDVTLRTHMRTHGLAFVKSKHH